MFTGLIQSLGTLDSLHRSHGGWCVRVAHRPWTDGALQAGESVAVQGACLTVQPLDEGHFAADVLDETLARTAFASLAPGASLNLERALRPSDRLGGHVVNGHVDETGRIVAIEPRGRDRVLRVACSPAFGRYVVLKGSVAVDGVSLTVSAIGDGFFEVNLVPTTWTATSLHERRLGDRVNLEADILAKHIERLLAAPAGPGRVSLATLADAGFLNSQP
jgi:riboflavin synthase